ncbi:SPOR domain-containing protein [Aerosakkonema sp. BLCC-F183]|uniref:SPOR domain-containing protein n=1 Tax=Aerosakkonema sp. BLCC-F183 TaxID=3342834 RepID=UPI0035B9DDCD
MSQLSPTQPRATSSATQPYSPVLQGVLTSLDVQLEDELARYRRLCPAKAVPPRPVGRPQVRKTLDLISIPATIGRTEAPIPATTAPESLPPFTSKNDVPIEAEVGDRESDTSNGAIAMPDLAIDPSSTPNLEHSPILAGAKGNFVTPVTAPMPPSEYLEPSPASLEHLGQQKATVEAERSFADNLLSPLGVGSMLLLLLSSATLGYIAMNPSSLSHLSVGRFFASGNLTAANSAEKNLSAGETKAREKGIPNSPNLASQEFVDLNLRSLSTLKPKNLAKLPPLPTPSSQLPVNLPVPLPSPVADAIPIDLPAALLPSSVQSGVLPQLGDRRPVTLPPPAQSNKATQGIARLAPAANKPNPPKAKSTPAQENKFLVVTAQNSDRSLAQVRKTIPEAFVRRLPQGNRIQVASFPSESQAQKKVRELQKQGISAQVYRL